MLETQGRRGWDWIQAIYTFFDIISILPVYQVATEQKQSIYTAH
jgi:hypothetical protein